MIIKTIQGTEVPALGLGTYRLQGHTCTHIVQKAIELGYRHIDTAQIYDNEKAVGEGIRKAGIDKKDLFVTTKVWHENLSEVEVPRVVDESLKNLNLEYIDLLLVHWPSTTQTPLEETLLAFEKERSEGKVRQIGVSNFPIALLKEALELTNIWNNQVEYHPFLNQDALLQLARQHDFALTAYRPIAKGKTNDDETLTDIGAKYGKSGVQVALRWLVQQEGVLAIPRTSDTAHLKSNFEIFDFELSDEEMSRIHQLTHRNLRQVDPDFAPKWD
jgi:2,5-diketo-D-gluconate reductase B